jgi:hypothetical protein
MPITRYLEHGSVFAPEALASMGQALEETCKTIGFGGDDKKRQVVAKFIIRLAQENGNLDAGALRNKAVAALGGVAYSAAAGVSQTDKTRGEADCRRLADAGRRRRVDRGDRSTS